MLCSNTSFIVDNIPPLFVSINSTCFTQGDGNFEERLSWDIQALSGIVAIHYSVSNTNNSQSFEPFSTLVNPHQLSYNIQPLLQGHSGIIYFILQAEKWGRAHCNRQYPSRFNMLQQMRNFHFILKRLFITLQDLYMKSVHSVVHCNFIKIYCFSCHQFLLFSLLHEHSIRTRSPIKL